MLLIGLVSVIVAAVLLASVFSGEGQEEPLELRPVGVACLAGVERALLQAGRDDLEADPVEGPGCRGELRHHVRAVAPVLDHLDDAADLALRPPEPLEHAGHRLAVHVHAGSPGVAHPAREIMMPHAPMVSYYTRRGIKYWREVACAHARRCCSPAPVITFRAPLSVRCLPAWARAARSPAS